jgi:hypothetical protein
MGGGTTRGGDVGGATRTGEGLAAGFATGGGLAAAGLATGGAGALAAGDRGRAGAIGRALGGATRPGFGGALELAGAGPLPSTLWNSVSAAIAFTCAGRTLRESSTNALSSAWPATVLISRGMPFVSRWITRHVSVGNSSFELPPATDTRWWM